MCGHSSSSSRNFALIGAPGRRLPKLLSRPAFGGKILVLLNREDYWQCAFVIAKGTADAIRRRGLESFRDEIAALAPFLRDRTGELQDWEQISLLTVAVDRLSR